MKKSELTYRMYCLVLRQLNGINKGVQAFHAGLEYANKFHNEEDFQKYITFDKTLIMLDGGIYQDLVEIKSLLEVASINHSVFVEPDLNDTITAICFLADERVWDRENYMSCESFLERFDIESNLDIQNAICHWVESIGGFKNAAIVDILKGKKLSI